MADSIGHQFLRTLQVPLHHAHQNQALQRGENYLSSYPSAYLSIYLSICLYCLPTNLFLFISLYFSHLALFGFVCIDWRLYSGAALTSPALSGAVSAARCSSTVPQHCVSSGRCVCSSSGPQTMSSVDWLVCISSLATPLPLAHCLLPPVVHDSTELHLLSHSQIGLSGQSWALSPWDSLAALSSCTFSARPICISAIAGRHATGRCPGQHENYWRLCVIWETKWKTRYKLYISIDKQMDM